MSNKGFTLIELIVVMAIIAVLVLLAAPRFLGYTKDASVTAMEQDTKVLADAAEMYHLNRGEWPIDRNAEPVSLGIGGVDQVYPIEASKLEDSIKNIKGNYNDYGVSIAGKYKGQVFHLQGIQDSKGKENYGHASNNLTPWVFKGNEYLSANAIPEDPVELYTFKPVEGGHEITGFDQTYIDDELKGVKPAELAIPSIFKEEKVVSIGLEAFMGDDLTRVILPKHVKKLGVRSFSKNRIKSVYLPVKLECIESHAFIDNLLDDIEFPSSIIHLHSGSFERNKLKSLQIPDSVIHIEHAAFTGNQLPEHQAYIYARNPDGTIDYSILQSYGGNADSVIIPETVISVGNYAFSRSGIKELVIPKNVKNINNSSFGYNGPLKNSNQIPTSGFHGSWSVVNGVWVKND